MSKVLAETIRDRACLGDWPPGHTRRIAVALTEAEWNTVVGALDSALRAPSTADDAVTHVLRTIRNDGRVAYLLGKGSESFRLLTRAHAEFHGWNVEAFRRMFWSGCAPDRVHAAEDLRLAESVTLHEVADGAYGDDPATRARARDLLSRRP